MFHSSHYVVFLNMRCLPFVFSNLPFVSSSKLGNIPLSKSENTRHSPNLVLNRVRRNPNLYGFETARDADHLDSMLMEMCVK